MMVALLGLLMAPTSVKGQSDPSLEDGFLVDDAAGDAFAQIILENGGVFEGGVEIGENVTSLKGLEGLTSVGGDLQIGGDPVLLSLGYDNVGGGNPQLTSLAGLEGLTSVGGGITISDNAQLTSLAGLEGLTSVGGDLYIGINAQLTSLAGLEGLTSVGGYLSIGVNAQLTSLAALEGLASVGGSFDIFDNGDGVLPDILSLE